MIHPGSQAQLNVLVLAASLRADSLNRKLAALCARLPRNLRIDQARAGAHVGETTAFGICMLRLERFTVVLESQRKVAFRRVRHEHLHFGRFRVSPDVVHCFLNDAIDLHLHARRQFAALFDCVITMKFVAETFFGRRILDRVVDVVAAATGAPPLIVANAPDAASWRPDLTVVPDTKPGFGSLGGIYTAVTAGPGPALAVAWDMPFVTAALLEALVGGAADYDAFLPESGGRRGLEPLCAVYGPACRAPIERQLAGDDWRAIGFHDQIRVGRLPLECVRARGDPERLFFNVNRPEDLVEAEARWRPHG